MKILITGGAGFVGSHLAESLLKKRHKIIVCTKTSVRNVENIKKKIELRKIDVTDYTKLEKLTVSSNVGSWCLGKPEINQSMFILNVHKGMSTFLQPPST